MLNPFEHRRLPYLARLSRWFFPRWLVSRTNPSPTGLCQTALPKTTPGRTGARQTGQRRVPNPEERARRRSLAEKQLSSLEDLPDHASRLWKIRQDPTLQTVELGFLLLEYSRWVGGTAGSDLADLTLELAETRLTADPQDRFARDLRAGALLSQSRWRESLEDIERAWRALAQARVEAEQGTGDALLWAELALEKGAVLRARGKLRQATLELAEAVRLLDHLGCAGRAAYGRGELALAKAELAAVAGGRQRLPSKPPRGLPSHLWQTLAGRVRAHDTERAARCLAGFRSVLEELDRKDSEASP